MANIHCHGEAVTALRTQQGMTQEKLAAMSKVNIRTIQRAEKGEQLQLETVASIAAALRVTVPTLTAPDGAAAPPTADDEGGENNAVVLRAVTSGKALLDMVYDSFTGTLGCEVEPTSENVDTLTAMVEEIEGLIPNPWAQPFDDNRLSLAGRLRRAVELSAKLAELEQIGIGVFVGTYTSTAQVPMYDMDERHMYVTNRTPYVPVTVCRVVLDTRTKDRVVIKVADKWEAPAPEKAEATEAETDDCPF
ncbi:MAG: helix-turn-helix domain-containing protein [Alphaproteobacteria bacterium]